jgi:hypothetical protein
VKMSKEEEQALLELLKSLTETPEEPTYAPPRVITNQRKP